MFSRKARTARESGVSCESGGAGGGGSLASEKSAAPIGETCASGIVSAYRSSGSGCVCVSSQKSGSTTLLLSDASLLRIRRRSTVATERTSSRWSGSTQVDTDVATSLDGVDRPRPSSAGVESRLLLAALFAALLPGAGGVTRSRPAALLALLRGGEALLCGIGVLLPPLLPEPLAQHVDGMAVARPSPSQGLFRRGAFAEV